MTQPETTSTTRLLWPIPDVGYTLGVGRSTVYGLIDTGELEGVKIGSRHLVTGESLAAYVERLRSA